MKKYILLAILLVLSARLVAQKNYNVATFNIRFATEADGVNQWNNRKEKVVSTIRFHELAICGMQEALIGQINDVLKGLPTYAYVGVGRDDGKEKGEFSPIIFDKARFELLKTATFWLNEHPESVGFGWDAHFNRVVTWAYFKDKLTKKKFYVFNTHFDHQGEIARRESAKLLLNKIQEIAGKNTPYIVMGDFNAKPQDEPIKILTNNNQPFFLKNSIELSEMPHFGPTGTFNGFAAKERDDDPIDYIFANDTFFAIKAHATLAGTWQGLFASDHFAVMATFYWK